MATKELLTIHHRSFNRASNCLIYSIIFGNSFAIRAIKLSPVQPPIQRLDINIETRILNDAFAEAYTYYHHKRMGTPITSETESDESLCTKITFKLQSVTYRWIAIEGRIRKTIPSTDTDQIKVTHTPCTLLDYTHVLTVYIYIVNEYRR